MKKFILSPCGTSILTNQASPQEKKLVFKYANEKKKMISLKKKIETN